MLDQTQLLERFQYCKDHLQQHHLHHLVLVNGSIRRIRCPSFVLVVVGGGGGGSGNGYQVLEVERRRWWTSVCDAG